jgi:hypothetical protein
VHLRYLKQEQSNASQDYGGIKHSSMIISELTIANTSATLAVPNATASVDLSSASTATTVMNALASRLVGMYLCIYGTLSV